MASHNVILISSGYDSIIRFWDISGGHTKRSIKYDDSQDPRSKIPVNDLCFTPDGRTIAACGVKSFKLFDSEGERTTPKYTNSEAHKASVNTIGFDEDGKMIYTCSDDKVCKLWDIRTTVCSQSVECRGSINQCVLHPNQKELFMIDENGYMRVWDITAQRILAEMYPDDNTPFHALAISPNGERIIACNKKGMVYLWKYTDHHINPETVFRAHDEYILSCKVSPNNNILATTSSDRSIKLWDMKTLENTSKLIGHEKWVWDCCFSCDSKNLVTASSDHNCRLWELKTGRTVRHYTGHDRTVSCVALYESM